MELNLRSIIKKVGITQQELADYLGITRQYLSNYLDEALENPQLPKKYMDSILFLFECKTREEFFDENLSVTVKQVRKRINRIKETKENFDKLFQVENEEKFEILEMINFLHLLMRLDNKLLESFTFFMESIIDSDHYHPFLSYLGKRNLIIEFDHPLYNSPTFKAKEALCFKAFDHELNFLEYEQLYEEFKLKSQKQNDIDIEALRLSLSQFGYSNISQKEIVEIMNKYNQIKKEE